MFEFFGVCTENGTQDQIHIDVRPAETLNEGENSSASTLECIKTKSSEMFLPLCFAALSSSIVLTMSGETDLTIGAGLLVFICSCGLRAVAPDANTSDDHATNAIPDLEISTQDESSHEQPCTLRSCLR